MGRRLNIQPRPLPLTPTIDLLNGALASLSGPVGFTPEQPRIFVREVQVTNTDASNTNAFALYKGASGANVSGTEVAEGSVLQQSTVVFPINQVFDAADFLTGRAVAGSANKLVVNIVAEIEA